MPDLEFAHAVLVLDCEPVDDAPILDLRLRKGVRRRGVQLAVATSRPSSLDANARLSVRYAPGAGEAFVAALAGALSGGSSDVGALARAAGAEEEAVRALATLLRGAGEDVVILWGERLTSGARAPHAARALLNLAGELGLTAGRAGAGLLEIPAAANGRGLREAGVLPNAGPGYVEVEPPTHGVRDAAAIAAAAAAGELSALYLLRIDPVRHLPGRETWVAALEQATTVVAHAQFLTEGLREHATVVFPAEAYAEKEGTIVHPDGRLQRLRAAIGHPGAVRAEWQVLAELVQAPGPRHRGAHRGDGQQAAVRGRAVLRRADARGDRRQGRALAGPRRRRRASRRPPSGRSTSSRPSPPRRPTGACAWGPSARSGPPRRSTSPPRCASCTPASTSRSRPPTPSA